jgi:hypothetical protein
VTRHMLGLGTGFPGARKFRQLLSVDIHKTDDPHWRCWTRRAHCSKAADRRPVDDVGAVNAGRMEPLPGAILEYRSSRRPSLLRSWPLSQT